ncbi:hypothetical protein [Rufibacter sp. LB8]|uniref:hypothetical protein n=1 Tax=Rufibacter sp. LB8 TaxID=2777781 RepID=UPI00178C1DCE|nr:hypothetical protein [Rufibacter sp. LB8]
MRLFPARVYSVELENDCASALEDLRIHTKISSSLVSVPTDKAFIGMVDETTFKVIMPKIGSGGFCVLTGEFQGKEGIIQIKIHTVFKILTSILMILPFISVGLTLLRKDLENSIGLIPPILMSLLFIRFVFLGLSFQISAKKSLNLLSQILRVNSLHRIS